MGMGAGFGYAYKHGSEYLYEYGYEWKGRHSHKTIGCMSMTASEQTWRPGAGSIAVDTRGLSEPTNKEVTIFLIPSGVGGNR